MIHLKDDRQAAIKAMYDSGLLPEGWNLLKTEEQLKDWALHAVVRKDETIGLCMIQSKEIHFCIRPDYHGKWLTRGLLKEISQLDFEYTTAPVDDEDSQFFVERMGFKPLMTAGDDIIYQLDKLTHG